MAEESFWKNPNVVRIVGVGKIAFGLALTCASASIPVAAAIAAVAITATVIQRYDNKLSLKENAKKAFQSFNTYVGAAIGIMVPAVAAGLFVGDVMQKVITGQGGYFAEGALAGSASLFVALPIVTAVAGFTIASGIYNVVTGKESHVVEPIVNGIKAMGKPFLKLLGFGRGDTPPPSSPPMQPRISPITPESKSSSEVSSKLSPQAAKQAIDHASVLDPNQQRFDVKDSPKASPNNGKGSPSK